MPFITTMGEKWFLTDSGYLQHKFMKLQGLLSVAKDTEDSKHTVDPLYRVLYCVQYSVSVFCI